MPIRDETIVGRPGPETNAERKNVVKNAPDDLSCLPSFCRADADNTKAITSICERHTCARAIRYSRIGKLNTLAKSECKNLRELNDYSADNAHFDQ